MLKYDFIENKEENPSAYRDLLIQFEIQDVDFFPNTSTNMSPLNRQYHDYTRLI